MLDHSVVNEILQELANKGTEIAFRVVSGSMSPLIAVNDRIVVDPAKSEETLRIGDIILFKKPDDTFLVHRLIGKRVVDGKLYVREKGDASLDSSLLSYETVFGRVSAIQRGEREIDITTPAWRKLNTILGITSASFDILMRGLGFINHLVQSKERPGRLTGVIRRVALKVQQLGLRLALKGMTSKS